MKIMPLKGIVSTIKHLLKPVVVLEDQKFNYL